MPNNLAFTKLNNGWNADPNIPLPEFVQAEGDLLLSFRLNHYQFPEFTEQDIGIIRFARCARYRLDGTNDHAWYGGQCRYSRLAPAWGEFYEITGKDHTLDEVEGWIRIYGSNESLRHFLFYFRDDMFECLAQDWCFEPAQENALHQRPGTTGRSTPND